MNAPLPPPMMMQPFGQQPAAAAPMGSIPGGMPAFNPMTGTAPAAMQGQQPGMQATQTVGFAQPVVIANETREGRAQRIFAGAMQAAPIKPEHQNMIPTLAAHVSTPRGWFSTSNSKAFLLAVDTIKDAAKYEKKHAGDPVYAEKIASKNRAAEEKADHLLQGLVKKLPEEARDKALTILTDAAKVGGKADAENDHLLEMREKYIALLKSQKNNIAKLAKATLGERDQLMAKIQHKVAKAMKGMPEAAQKTMLAQLTQTTEEQAQQIHTANPTTTEQIFAHAKDAVTGSVNGVVTTGLSTATGGLVNPATMGMASNLLKGGQGRGG